MGRSSREPQPSPCFQTEASQETDQAASRQTEGELRNICLAIDISLSTGPDIKTHAIQLQNIVIHTCRQDYCQRASTTGGPCRFEFPKPQRY